MLCLHHEVMHSKATQRNTMCCMHHFVMHGLSIQFNLILSLPWIQEIYSYFFPAPYLDRPCFRFFTACRSLVPRTTLYLTPGKSLTLPPRMSTTECSCRLCPSPGMKAITERELHSRTFATLRRAELGFLGVRLYTFVQIPLLCGDLSKAGLRTRRVFLLRESRSHS